MKLAERNVAVAPRPAHVDRRVQRRQRNAHVRGVHCDAMLASTQDRMHPRPAVLRVAAAPWIALVAARGEIPVVGAARPLHEVPGDCGHVAKLWGGTGKQRLGKGGKPAPHLGMGRDRAVGGGRAETDAIRRGLDARQIEPRHVDDASGIEHLDLHQVDERRTPAEESGAGLRRHLDRFVDAPRTLVGDLAHHTLLRTAATMLGYAPQRQMFPLIPSRISSSPRPPPSWRKPMQARICPGVQ